MNDLGSEPAVVGAMEIGASQCQAILAASIDQARSLGVRVSVAVVDSGGNLKAFLRMDGAEIAGPLLAVDKAYTAVANQAATHDLAVQAAPGGPLFGLHTCGAGRFVIFGGGLPVIAGAAVVGGIGVSGAAVEEDVACASAGLAVAEELLRSGSPEPSGMGTLLHGRRTSEGKEPLT